MTVRVLRGTPPAETDEWSVERLLDRVGRTRESLLRVWRPGRRVAFGPRDARSPGYELALERARERGFEPTDRRIGGRAAAFTETTVAFALALPITDFRTGIGDRYDRAVTAVQRALWDVDVPAQRGEPPESFCPGTRALQYRGKLAGVGQRVRTDGAIVSGLVIVDGHQEIANVLVPVYDALSLPLDPDTVGSVERAGGRADPDLVARALEDRLVGERDRTIERYAYEPSGNADRRVTDRR